MEASATVSPAAAEVEQGTASTASTEPTRRQLSPRQAETVRRLTEAAVEEIRDVSYERLTVRTVARRAGVAPATAYTYFASKDHLVTEVFWRWLEALPPTERRSGVSVAEHVGETMADLALLVADEPELAAGCTCALLAADTEVKLLRDLIGSTMRDRLRAALGDRSCPVVLRTLELSVTGALVQAGMGHLSYEDLPAQLREVADLVVGNGLDAAPKGGDA
jgi:AcrR family transcriptional regulator